MFKIQSAKPSDKDMIGNKNEARRSFYFPELEGLRGLLALWVVVGHWFTTVPMPSSIASTKLYNGFAVDVFIFLSGFVIMGLLKRGGIITLHT